MYLLQRTPLNIKQNFLYELWKKNNGVLDDNTYDMPGYYKDIASKGSSETEMKPDGMHFPDTYKTMRHPTISSESKYYPPQLPPRNWVDGGDNGWALMDSATNQPIHSESTDLFLKKLLEFGK